MKEQQKERELQELEQREKAREAERAQREKDREADRARRHKERDEREAADRARRQRDKERSDRCARWPCAARSSGTAPLADHLHLYGYDFTSSARI